ncbi:C-terminal binding protein, partial [Paenibacillus sepulcri]|nr:C-terminal binding protein [Paenibacillus sepulcri]
LQAIAYDPYAPEESFRELGVERVDWETLLRRSDVLSLHLPLTSETRGIMSMASFRLMKPSAFLINTSRGGILRADDLVTALQEGMIAGAALDVLENEPIDPAHPLLQLEQCLITSHCAWYSEDSLMRLQEYAALEIKRLFSGERPLHIVNGVEARL